MSNFLPTFKLWLPFFNKGLQAFSRVLRRKTERFGHKFIGQAGMERGLKGIIHHLFAKPDGDGRKGTYSPRDGHSFPIQIFDDILERDEGPPF